MERSLTTCWRLTRSSGYRALARSGDQLACCLSCLRSVWCSQRWVGPNADDGDRRPLLEPKFLEANTLAGHVVQGGVSVTVAGPPLLYVKRPSVRFASREIELKEIVHDHRPSSCAPLSSTFRMAKNESLRVRQLQTPIVLFDPPCCEWQGFHMAQISTPQK